MAFPPATRQDRQGRQVDDPKVPPIKTTIAIVMVVAMAWLGVWALTTRDQPDVQSAREHDTIKR